MEKRQRKFYFYRDILICLEEVKGLMVRHRQSDWYLDLVYTEGTLLSYVCRHRDEAQGLFQAISSMLKAEEITIEGSSY